MYDQTTSVELSHILHVVQKSVEFSGVGLFISAWQTIIIIIKWNFYISNEYFFKFCGHFLHECVTKTKGAGSIQPFCDIWLVKIGYVTIRCVPIHNRAIKQRWSIMLVSLVIWGRHIARQIYVPEIKLWCVFKLVAIPCLVFYSQVWRLFQGQWCKGE